VADGAAVLLVGRRAELLSAVAARLGERAIAVTADSAAAPDMARNLERLERSRGTRATFADGDSTADLGQVLAAIPPQQAAGFITFCIKPSQFIHDPADVERLCREVFRGVGHLT
jgi:hypothetical protein